MFFRALKTIYFLKNVNYELVRFVDHIIDGTQIFLFSCKLY